MTDKQDEPRKFRVHLAATTPLAENPAVIEARDEGEAKAKFFVLNGISASEHALTINEIDDETEFSEPTAAKPSPDSLSLDDDE